MRDPESLTERHEVERVSASAPIPEAFEVEVVEGPDVGLRFTVDASSPRVLVGQGPACDARLTDPTVSRRHLSLEVDAKGLRLRDLGSSNGTYGNGLLVVDVTLAGGELVRVGSSVLRVGALGPSSTPVTDGRTRFGRTLGASPAMRRLYGVCDRLATSSIPVVIEGETGTGKELLAESLHELGPRKERPFVVFDCTAVPSTLVESALFGHERGAFTGATAARAGVFEQAEGGTLLIDEIGDLDLALQPKLLRAVERAEVQRVGSATWRRADVRVIAATRRNLDREVEAGRFREDLFFRLAVGRIELPPLRDREGDVRLLAHAFWQQQGGGPARELEILLSRLEGHAWPGNVRQLSNTIARHIALGDVPTAVEPAPGVDLFATILAEELPLPRARARVVAELERRYVERVLAKHGGHVGRAAEASGIARRYFEIVRARSRG